MARKRKGSGDGGDVVEMLRDLLITQLGIAGVPQANIRRIVGCSITRVNSIVKHLKIPKRKAD